MANLFPTFKISQRDTKKPVYKELILKGYLSHFLLTDSKMGVSFILPVMELHTFSHAHLNAGHSSMGFGERPFSVFFSI